MIVVEILSIFLVTRKDMEQRTKRHIRWMEGNEDDILKPCEVNALYLCYSLLTWGIARDRHVYQHCAILSLQADSVRQRPTVSDSQVRTASPDSTDNW